MTNLARDIVTSLIESNDKKATMLFELAMAKTIKLQMEDYKAELASKMFESTDGVDNDFMPAKRDYTIHAIDPSKRSDRLPEGEPVQYKASAYTPQSAYKQAVANGHTVVKVIDSVGNEVTDDAKKGSVNEGTETGTMDSELTAQRREEKKQADLENAQTTSKQKSPTIQDVISVLGNTVSVADTSSVN